MARELVLTEQERNRAWVDLWSLTHVAWGAALCLALPPFWALAAMVLWEPVEVLLLSPLLARVGLRFGHEHLQNSLMDMVFNVAGVLLGTYVLLPRWDPFGIV